MLRNRYRKIYWWYRRKTKIILKNPQEGVVLTPSLGIGGLVHKYTLNWYT